MYQFLVAINAFILLLSAKESFSVQWDKADLFFNQNLTSSSEGKSSTNTYAQAINYGQTHPTRDGGSWSGW